MILFGSSTHKVHKKSVKNKGRKWEYLGVFSAVGDNSPLSMKPLWPEREVLWVIGGLGVGELTLCPRTCWGGKKKKNGWMWVIPQTETDNKRATEQEERALAMWLLMSVYCKSPCWFWRVFFFSGCSSGRCCFFLVSWGDVAFKERDSGGGGEGWLSLHVRLRIKQKP